MDRIKLKFIKPYKCYNLGEVAGFYEAEAKVILNGKKAVLVEEPKQEIKKVVKAEIKPKAQSKFTKKSVSK